VIFVAVNGDGYRRERYRSVGEKGGSDLVAATSAAIGSFLHGFSDEIADTDGDVADDDTGHNLEERIGNHADDRGANTVEDGASEGSVTIGGESGFYLGGAGSAGHDAVDAVIAVRDGLLADSALVGTVCGGERVLGLVKARKTG
jgi:hypothetical protein